MANEVGMTIFDVIITSKPNKCIRSPKIIYKLSMNWDKIGNYNIYKN